MVPNTLLILSDFMALAVTFLLPNREYVDGWTQAKIESSPSIFVCTSCSFRSDVLPLRKLGSEPERKAN